MSPAVSVTFVVPVLNESGRIHALLAHLKGAFPDARRIVVDGQSTDETVKAARVLADQVLVGEPGRAAQMNLGAAGASSDYLCFLHADTEPRFDQAYLLQALQDQPEWGFFPVELSGASGMLRVIQQGINWRSRLTGVATGDQLMFVRRELFEQLRGFASIPLMEDVELSKRLRRVSRPRVMTLPVRTSSRRWPERGFWRTMLQMWWMRLAYVCGASPRWLYQHYYGR